MTPSIPAAAVARGPAPPVLLWVNGEADVLAADEVVDAVPEEAVLAEDPDADQVSSDRPNRISTHRLLRRQSWWLWQRFQW